MKEICVSLREKSCERGNSKRVPFGVFALGVVESEEDWQFRIKLLQIQINNIIIIQKKNKKIQIIWIISHQLSFVASHHSQESNYYTHERREEQPAQRSYLPQVIALSKGFLSWLRRVRTSRRKSTPVKISYVTDDDAHSEFLSSQLMHMSPSLLIVSLARVVLTPKFSQSVCNVEMCIHLHWLLLCFLSSPVYSMATRLSSCLSSTMPSWTTLPTWPVVWLRSTPF